MQVGVPIRGREMSKTTDQINAENVLLWRDVLRVEIDGAIMKLPAAARAGQGGQLIITIQHGARVLAEPLESQQFIDVARAASAIGTAVEDWENRKAGMEYGA